MGLCTGVVHPEIRRAGSGEADQLATAETQIGPAERRLKAEAHTEHPVDIALEDRWRSVEPQRIDEREDVDVLQLRTFAHHIRAKPGRLGTGDLRGL